MKLPLFLFLCLFFALPSFSATFTVNSTTDLVDAHPGDGICETSPGNGVCTLRAAVQEAGALSSANQIVVPAGTYLLSATPACSYRLVTNSNLLTENMSALCVKGNVTITGAGSDLTIIDAGGAGGATCCGSYPSARGMVIALGSVVTLSGVTIQNGRSNGGYEFVGGGAINNQGSLKISYCALIGNNGPPGGAGIWNDGTLVADNINFSANIAGAYGGGGLFNNSFSKAEISNSTFNLNQANGGGGGAVANTGVLKILSSTLSNNTTTGNGGAINNDYGSVALTNVTIASNQGFTAGGIWNYQAGTMTVNNSTITLNHATNHTGGVSNSKTFIISNSIIGGNFDDVHPAAPTDCDGPITSQGHNLISSITGTCVVAGSTTGDIYGVPPGLAALTSNGGSTQTLALTGTSKAIDAGDPTTPGTGGTSCAAADQRGFLRPQNGRCDIGAFERNSTLSISGIAPTHAANTSIAEGVVFGSGILAGAGVSLRKSGQADIVGTQVGVQDGNSSLAAEFDLSGKAPGAWDIVVTNPDASTYTRPAAFQIDPGGSANVWALVGGTPVARPGSMATYFVLFGNRGNVDALDVPVTLSVPTSIPLSTNFFIAPPPTQLGQVATDWTQVPTYVTPGPSSGFVNVPLLLPIIPAGFTGSLRFSVTVPSNLVEGDSFQLYASSGSPLLQVGADPSALISQLAASAAAYAQGNLGVTIPSSENTVLNQYVANQLQNLLAAARAQFTATSGSIPLAYSLAQLNIDAAQFAVANVSAASPAHTAFAKAFKPLDTGGNTGPSTLCTTQDGKVVSIKVGDVQPPGSSCKDPEIYVPPPPCTDGLKSSAEHPCLNPDTPNPLTPSQCREIPNHHVSNSGGLCLPNPGQGCAIIPNPLQGVDPRCAIVPIGTSVDPNAKSGPFGPGAQQFHTSGTAYNYEVEFQNQPTASLPAQQVVVTDNLDKSNLDLSTFTLGPVSFGSYTFTPPSSAQHFSGGIDLRPDLNLIVKLDAGLNLSTGVVTWRFTSLDPDTQQITTDASAGFLPPDITPPQGEGRMLYTIYPKAGIVSGTTVCNQASVVFDTNAAINTQNWCNTVDDTAPSSSVTKLPATEANASFSVQWSGSDTGSGINDYTIYVSDNGGSYVAWLSNTNLTGSTYAGTVGHSYAFYSIAQDMVGNTEGAKGVPDTSTIVTNGVPACATDATAQFSIVRGGYRYNNTSKRFQQTVTITRTAAGSLAGPFAFAIEALDADATLYSPTGVTSCIVPGSAYLVLNPGASWTSGQALSFTLDFVDPKKTGITYTPLMLTGATR